MNAQAVSPDPTAYDAEAALVLTRLRRSAVAVALLSLAFEAFFQLAKHVPTLASANPSVDDPFDAIGSFAVQAALLLAAVSLARAWWPRRPLPTSPQVCGLVRTQFVSVSAVVMTIVGDLVALGRHPGVWVGAPNGPAYVGSLAALTLATIGVGTIVLQVDRSCVRWSSAGALLRACASLVALAAALWIFPEGMRASVLGELVAVVLGAVLLFVPMAEFALAIVPYSVNRFAEVVALPEWLHSEYTQWAIVVSAGVGAGGLIAIAEALSIAGGSLKIAAVAAYLGLETIAVAIGFAMLRGPLGLRYPS